MNNPSGIRAWIFKFLYAPDAHGGKVTPQGRMDALGLQRVKAVELFAEQVIPILRRAELI
jgi:hypothetical protein